MANEKVRLSSLGKTVRRRLRIFAIVVCSGALLVAGCQNGGYELQSALLSAFNMYSYEAAEMIALKLDLDERALARLPKAEQQFYRTFQETTLTIADHITVGRDKESIVGALEFGGGEIPFIYTRNGGESALYVEGAQKPIVFNKEVRFKPDRIEVTEDEIGPAPESISRTKKAEWSPYFSAVSGQLLPFGGTTGAWLPGGTMIYKSSEYDRWRSARIDEIRAQKKKALTAAGELREPGYGQWIISLLDTLEKSKPLVGDFLFYAVRNTPYPQSSVIDKVEVETAGQKEQLNRLRIQAGGSGFAEMLVGMFQSFAENPHELKKAAESLYDLSTVYVETRLDRLRELDPTGEETAALQLYLGDRNTMAGNLYDELKTTIDETLAGANENEGGSEEGSSLLERAAMEFEFYYKGSIGRAAGLELYIPLPSSDELPLNGLHVSYAMQRWNIGNEIPLKTIDMSKGRLDYFQADGGYPFDSPYELLRFFDPKSSAYALLEAFDLEGVDIDFPVVDGTLWEGEQTERIGNRAYIERNATLVPLRFVSEQLYADVQWNGEKREVTITDAANGRVIVLAIGSTAAQVDGKPVTLEAAPVISPSGKTYVPIRFIAETLGADVTWNGELRRVGVKK